MKIALSGASSTGKTSVARQFLLTEFAISRGFSICDVGSRALLEYLGLGLADQISSSDYRVFEIMYISRKLYIESSESIFITERSFADCLAYWRIHCAPTATPDEQALIENVCLKSLRSYDRHFLFPTGFLPLEQDGFRHTQIAYHEKFNRILEGIFQDCGIVPVTMPRASIEDRVEFLVRELND